MEPLARLRYKLNRRQRLVSHLKVWHVGGPLLVAASAVFLVRAFSQNAWFFLVALLCAWSCRGYILGFINIFAYPIQEMDIIIEPLGIGFLIENERWYIHMEGVISIRQWTKGVWTIEHRNGTVINVPSDCMPDACVEHIRAAIKGGWTYLKPFADKHKQQLKKTRPDDFGD